jgi:MFS family permease
VNLLDYAPKETSPGRFDYLLRALRSRNYRLYFGGQLISLVGNFVTQVATAWLVFRLASAEGGKAHAAMMLGIVGFSSQIPLFLIAPFAGVLVDRWNKRSLIITTQALAMCQSLALAALTLSGAITLPQIIALSVFQGLINSFDIPGRQAFLVEIITDRADLSNAIALNSTMVHGARLVGPALGGLLIHYFSEGYCFLIDGISYIAVIMSLLAMTGSYLPHAKQRASVLAELREGLAYVSGYAPVAVLLLLLALLSLTAMPAYTVLMPIFGDALSNGQTGAQTLGFLMGASGLGALGGALYLASRESVVGLGRVIACSASGFGAGLIVFAFSNHLWLSLCIVPFSGLGMILSIAGSNTVLQTLVDDHIRGRVMSLFTLSFMGMAPFGSLLAGYMAAHLGGGVEGARRTLMINGSITVCAGMAFWLTLPALRKLVWPVYQRKGIIPAVAKGIREAADLSRAR